MAALSAPRNDRRSRKLVVLAHCILNQNARLDGCACYPGAIPQVVELLVARGYGLLQLPCPEMAVSDWRRSRRTKEQPFIRQFLEQPEGRACCRALAEGIATQVRDYCDNGFLVAAVIGKDRSPACGVSATSWDGTFVPGSGVFIEELRAALATRGVTVPIVGMADDSEEEVADCIRWLQANLK